MQKSPRHWYQENLETSVLTPDPAQLPIIDLFENLYQNLISSTPSASIIDNVKNALSTRAPQKKHKGIYLWGKVGRGKTHLMDCFYKNIDIPHKQRFHFHRFMQNVHQELKQVSGEKDPLKLVANKISQEAQLLCFDEFYVSDIADAMILSGLLSKLFDNGTLLVATSNQAPTELYRNGLQRQKFLPTITLLEQHTQVIELCGTKDHRLRALSQSNLYLSPLSDNSQQALEKIFEDLTGAPIKKSINNKSSRYKASKNIEISILDRIILADYQVEDVVWFDFNNICRGPRSQNDYIEIANQFSVVFISNVPSFIANNEAATGEKIRFTKGTEDQPLDPTINDSRAKTMATMTKDDDEVRRFISLVDEFYDQGINLIISAEVPIMQLYQSSRDNTDITDHRHLSFEFERTKSRLIEMQSESYHQHRPHQ